MSILSIRDVRRSDVPFITSTWLRSFRDEGELCAGIPNTVYYFWHHRLIAQLLSTSYVLVACADTDPDLVLGYAVADVPENAKGVLVVHYLYVKRSARGVGVARALAKALDDHFRPSVILYTHRTRSGKTLARKYAATYNPYILFIEGAYDTPAAERKELEACDD